MWILCSLLVCEGCTDVICVTVWLWDGLQILCILWMKYAWILYQKWFNNWKNIGYVQLTTMNLSHTNDESMRLRSSAISFSGACINPRPMKLQKHYTMAFMPTLYAMAKQLIIWLSQPAYHVRGEFFCCFLNTLMSCFSYANLHGQLGNKHPMQWFVYSWLGKGSLTSSLYQHGPPLLFDHTWSPHMKHVVPRLCNALWSIYILHIL